MPSKVQCPECGKIVDARGVTGHARTHGLTDVSKEDFQEVNMNELEQQDGKTVREAESEQEVLETVEENGDQLVGVEDDAIVFRNEVIVTDPEIKERIADKLVEQGGISL